MAAAPTAAAPAAAAAAAGGAAAAPAKGKFIIYLNIVLSCGNQNGDCKKFFCL